MDNSNINSQTTTNRVALILLSILTCECMIGSSGRWLEIGPLSIRMVIFIAAFAVSLPLLAKHFRAGIQNKIVITIIVFVGVIGIWALIGYFNSNPLQYIVTDINSMLFLAIIPAYIAVFDSKEKIQTLMKGMNIAALILAGITVLIHFMLRVISFDAAVAFNGFINSMDLGGLFAFDDGMYRIYFRSSVCFIFPLLYNLDRVIHVRSGKGRKERRIAYSEMILAFVAIILTFTRSIWLGSALACILFFLCNVKLWKKMVSVAGMVLLGFGLFVLISWAWYGQEGILSNVKERIFLNSEFNSYESLENIDVEQQRLMELESEQKRSEMIIRVHQQIKEHPIFGSGLGLTLDESKYKGKIEYTFLDITAKMGFIGLAAFLAVLGIPFYYALKRRKQDGFQSYVAIMMGVVVCFYGASVFNPYITSPIGWSMYGVLVAGVCVLRPQSEPTEELEEMLDIEEITNQNI
ncbi:MAG: O-antigen ligase family protein [Anaerofustis sp.]